MGFPAEKISEKMIEPTPARPTIARATRRKKSRAEAADRRSLERNPHVPGYTSRKNEPLVDGLTRTELLTKFSGKVRCIAIKLARHLPYSVELDDLISVGLMGLMDAADRYQSSKGAKFETYAEFRIRGSMIDELRSQDWVPRSMRMISKAIETTANQLQARMGRNPSDSELGKEMGLELEYVQKMRERMGHLSLVSFEDPAAIQNISEGPASDRSAPAHDPIEEIHRKNLQALIEKASDTLTPNEKLVISCYYYRELNLREISHIMQITESRVSQIHSRAITKIKQRLHAQKDVQTPKLRDVENLFLSLLGV